MNILNWIVEVELEQMSKYLQLLGGALNARLEEIESEYNDNRSRVHAYDEHDEWLFEEAYIEDYAEVRDEFTSLLLNSFIVMWYSFVEQQLLKLCEQLQLTITVKATDRLYLGKGVQRAKLFLQEATGSDGIDKSYWQELDDIRELRNVIVHAGNRIRWSYKKPEQEHARVELPPGTLPDEDQVVYVRIGKKLHSYLTEKSLLKFSGAWFAIQPSYEYCNDLVDFGKRFFGDLSQALYSKR